MRWLPPSIDNMGNKLSKEEPQAQSNGEEKKS